MDDEFLALGTDVDMDYLRAEGTGKLTLLVPRSYQD